MVRGLAAPRVRSPVDGDARRPDRIDTAGTRGAGEPSPTARRPAGGAAPATSGGPRLVWRPGQGRQPEPVVLPRSHAARARTRTCARRAAAPRARGGRRLGRRGPRGADLVERGLGVRRRFARQRRQLAVEAAGDERVDQAPGLARAGRGSRHARGRYHGSFAACSRVSPCTPRPARSSPAPSRIPRASGGPRNTRSCRPC